MNIREERIIKLKALTPIFIGSGESIKPFSYLLDGNTAYVIDEEKFFSQLLFEEQQRYQQWVESIIYPLSQLDDQINQAKDDFDRRRQLQRQRREIESGLSLWHFLANVLRTRPLPFVKQCVAYAVRCTVPPERDGFRLCMKDMAHNPYIPGTEIKGALRTASLYTLVSDAKNYPWLRDRLLQIHSLLRKEVPYRDKIRKLEKVGDELEAKLLRGIKQDEIRDDAKFDFLRMCHVSDSTSLPSTALRVEMTQMLGTKRYTKTWIETLTPGSEFSSRISLGDPAIILKELGLERLDAWLSFPKLLETCYIRSKEILEEETKYFCNEPLLKTLIAQLQRENQLDSPLLRLGQGQGFLGTTIDLLVKRRDAELYDKAIREGVSLQRRWRTQKDNFPKTRRVIFEKGGTAVNTLGWVKIIS